MVNAGKLGRRALFQSPEAGRDGYGNEVTGAWVDRFTRWTGVQFLKGGEAVMGARLEGRQPAVMTVRADSETALITPEWRCVVGGRVYNIREFPRLSDDRLSFEFLSESGVAT